MGRALPISKYGTDVFAKYLLLAGVALIVAFALIPAGVARWGVVGIVVLFLGFLINFFRDPARVTPAGEGIVISPADGRVVVVKEFVSDEFVIGDAVQVSIFMSPLNVHVNRFPISGTVGYFKHIPGEYLVAFDEKSSARNERTHIGVEERGYRVLFKQIAGTVARRIVANLTVGQAATRGERFGMIKFGSRVDVIMPRSSRVSVKLNDRVTAGETILATYGDSGNDVTLRERNA
jgi:phosphatidylserine decarboxylase